MNHKQFFTRGIMLVLVVLLTACAAPKATHCPTTVPQSCPTAAAQVMPEMNAWRLGWNAEANVIFTFDPGDKCSMEVIHPITGYDWNTLTYEIVVNDQTYKNYLVDTFTVDPGMTLAEIKAGSPSSSIPPPFVHLKEVVFVNPMSRTLHISAVSITEGPLFFVCSVQDPGDQRIIEFLGPLEVPTK